MHDSAQVNRGCNRYSVAGNSVDGCFQLSDLCSTVAHGRKQLANADKRTLGELMKSFQDLVKRGRMGTMRSSEFSDPTITVTSLGEQGVDTVFGVIYPPQVALVAFGKFVE